MSAPRNAFDAPPLGGAASGPAKRLRFRIDACRASHVTPEPKPAPRRPREVPLPRCRRAGAAER